MTGNFTPRPIVDMSETVIAPPAAVATRDRLRPLFCAYLDNYRRAMSQWERDVAGAKLYRGISGAFCDRAMYRRMAAIKTIMEKLA